MPDTPLDPASAPPDDSDRPGPLSPEDAAFDARLAALDADEPLADLVAARSNGTETASDRTLWALVEARRTTDSAFHTRVEALEIRARALNPADPVARFRRLAAAHPMPGTVTEPAQASREPRHRTDRVSPDRVSTARVRETRPRWRTGMLAALVLLAGAVVVLRIVSPRVVEPNEVAAPDVFRGDPAPVVGAPKIDPRAIYDRAAAHLAQAERSIVGIHVGVDAGALASAQAALDSVAAATPDDAALYFDALYLRGVACQLVDDRDCARDAFRAVVDGAGPKAEQARQRLARLDP